MLLYCLIGFLNYIFVCPLFKFIAFIVCIRVLMLVYAQAQAHMSTCHSSCVEVKDSHFSPFSVGVLGIQSRFTRVNGKHLYSLGHLTVPVYTFLNALVSLRLIGYVRISDAVYPKVTIMSPVLVVCVVHF